MILYNTALQVLIPLGMTLKCRFFTLFVYCNINAHCHINILDFCISCVCWRLSRRTTDGLWRVCVCIKEKWNPLKDSTRYSNSLEYVGSVIADAWEGNVPDSRTCDGLRCEMHSSDQRSGVFVLPQAEGAIGVLAYSRLWIITR